MRERGVQHFKTSNAFQTIIMGRGVGRIFLLQMMASWYVLWVSALLLCFAEGNNARALESLNLHVNIVQLVIHDSCPVSGKGAKVLLESAVKNGHWNVKANSIENNVLFFGSSGDFFSGWRS